MFYPLGLTVAQVLCFGVCLKSFLCGLRWDFREMTLIRYWLPGWNLWFHQEILDGEENLCSFITCLYVLLFAFYYQVKISFFYWPSHKPVKSALLHKKEKDTESKARCTMIEHTLIRLFGLIATEYAFPKVSKLYDTTTHIPCP